MEGLATLTADDAHVQGDADVDNQPRLAVLDGRVSLEHAVPEPVSGEVVVWESHKHEARLFDDLPLEQDRLAGAVLWEKCQLARNDEPRRGWPRCWLLDVLQDAQRRDGRREARAGILNQRTDAPGFRGSGSRDAETALNKPGVVERSRVATEGSEEVKPSSILRPLLPRVELGLRSPCRRFVDSSRPSPGDGEESAMFWKR